MTATIGVPKAGTTPSRMATFVRIARAIQGGLPIPQSTTIPERWDVKWGATVQLVVKDRAAVQAWAVWLGAGPVQAHPLPDRSTRHDVRLDGWLGWTAIVVSARVRPSTRGGA